MDISRCQCLKSDLEQCHREASKNINEDPRFCWQHQKCQHIVGDTPIIPRGLKGELPLSKTKIKISEISKKSNPLCGIPSSCVGFIPVTDFDEPDRKFIDLVRCLKLNGVDENIMAIQLSILFNLTKTLGEIDSMKDIEKKKLLNNLFEEYCTAYSYWIYTHFYHNVLKKPQFDEVRSEIAVILPRLTLDKTYLKKFQFSDKLLNILHIVTVLGKYVHTTSSYVKGNYSLMDFINDVVDYKGEKFTGKSKAVSPKVGPPPIYTSELAYKFGCNCFCRTVLMGTLLKILASNGHIPIDPEDIRYVHQGGQQNCTDSHILLAIFISGDRDDLSNYLYVESTYNASTKTTKSNVMNYLDFSIDTHNKASTFHIANAPIDLIVISEYLNRNPLSLKTWLKYADDLLNDEIFNNILIFSPNITETERYYRIYQELSLFPNSSTIWGQYLKMMEALPMRVSKVGHELSQKVVYQGLNAVQILKKYLGLPTYKDAESIRKYFVGMVSVALERLG